MPNSIRKDCTHSVTYDNSTGFTRIRVNEGTTSNTGHGYYLTIPFSAPSNNFSFSVDFYTTGMGNDDFGIRVCDKTVLDNGGGFNSYGAWIITGQRRLAYEYGGFETSSVKYGDHLGNVENNVQYRYTFRLTDTQAYYCLTNLSTNAIVSEKTYNRTDSYSFSGSYYFYMGSGKFSSGSADKSVYFENLTIQENCMNPYPIGAIYISTNSINPSSLFGGTWEQIKDRFLLASGDTYIDGSVGGSANSELIKHSHTVNGGGHTHTGQHDIWNAGSSVSSSSNVVNWTKHATTKLNNVNSEGGHTHNVSTAGSSDDGMGKNLPPYIVVFIWKRIA